MDSISSKYIYTTANQSAKSKSWAVGARAPVEIPDYYFDSKGKSAVFKTICYSPAWLKLVDELLVNATDHLIRCLGTKDKVTTIRFNVEHLSDGNTQFTVYNDGASVEIAIHPVASEKEGKEIWVPTMIFGMLFQGEHQIKKDHSLTGGCHGLGCKLSNLYSTNFLLETANGQQLFRQQWSDNMETVHPHQSIDKKGPSYTKISFTPDMKIFDTRPSQADIDEIFYTRIIYTACYANLVDPKVKVYYNDKLVQHTAIISIAKTIFDTVHQTSFIFEERSKDDGCMRQYKWDVCIGCSKDSVGFNTSIVNGIVIRQGQHIDHIKGLIVSSVKDRLSKFFNAGDISPAIIADYICIFINCQLPGADWDGNTKSKLVIDIKRLKTIKLPPKFINDLSDTLKLVVEQRLKQRKKKADYDKYQPPNNKKTPHLNVLLIGEGDSPIDQMKIGISQTVGFDHVGLFSLGGVPMNVRKKSKVVKISDSKQYIRMNDQLTKNKVIIGLFQAIGLNPACLYKDPDEIKGLNFAYIVLGVDQDLDGKGCIMALIISLFAYYWPSLLEHGFVRWFPTPIVIAFPKAGGRVTMFYSNAEYVEWEKNAVLTKYNIRYYKGLGTHSRESIIAAFLAFGIYPKDHPYNQPSRKSKLPAVTLEQGLNMIKTFSSNPDSERLFDIYFGPDAKKRKVELCKPIDQLPIELDLRAVSSIDCNYILQYEALLFQKDNLERKLDSYIDGQNQAGRKVLNSILKQFTVSNHEMRVSQLAGVISKNENYHHGESSLMSSLTSKAFIATGGKQLPLLIPLSHFGSRMCGGESAASPRYIYTRLNKKLTDLVFPKEDYYMLSFVTSDGQQCEPCYFIPIIPMAIVESTELPSHGWKLKTWGRRVEDVIAIVKQMIHTAATGQTFPLHAMGELAPCTYDGTPYHWKGSIKYINGCPVSFGRYTLDGNDLHITELPLRVWTNRYIESIKEKDAKQKHPLIKGQIQSASDDMKVDIKIKLAKGAIEYLESQSTETLDGIEKYFMLYSHMDSHLNMMTENLAVVEFKHYYEILHRWFDVRRQHYNKRIDRHITLAQLRIKELENQIRYIKAKLSMSDISNEDQDKALTSLCYDRISSSLLHNPEFTKTEDLANLIMNNDLSTFDYLLNLTDRAKSKQGLAKIENKLQKEIDDLATYNQLTNNPHFRGYRLWLRELDKLEIVVGEGKRTNWLFEEYGKFVYK